MTSPQYKVKLTQLAKEFAFEEINIPENIDEIFIRRSDMSRPGLPLTGFFTNFESERIQLLGNMEYSYLSSLSPSERFASIDRFLQHNVIALIITSNLAVFPEISELSKKYNTPVFRTPNETSAIMASLIASLNVSLAERITRHGVLVEVYGEGVLILGDSGIGKSETAIELVKRGHRLIADDAVEIKKVSSKTLVGSAPEVIKHYIELRGIGIVDIRRIFGMGSVKDTEKIDLVTNFELWEPGKIYERVGLDTEYTEILGIKIPSVTVPVKPGRNLAVIIEIAAMNNRQKKMGYNTAVEFNNRLIAQMENRAKETESKS
ncbi:MAG: HPr(Ser) kinase/phosphatase [Eubacteriales bacterium]|nr:HPr(Ser) kinase/phosphatase [Eubacteriales bacterium]MDD4421784.1 HPr(Ser) kinase/phosphatase [Eubacteriales bacterium]HBR30673.1 HPr(Ser) kinase/phosphatase [Clostridiales bacterium]